MTSFILDWIRELGVWTWGIVGALLLIVELLIPGIYLFWLGLAAIAVAVQGLWLPMPWQMQIVIFIVYSGLLVWVSRRFDRAKPESDQPNLNNRASSMIGREATLGTAIVDGTGTLLIDDTQWRVSGPDLSAGTRIRINSVDGNMLCIAGVDSLSGVPEPGAEK